MKTIKGINFIRSQKSGSDFMILHLLDDSFVDTVNHEDILKSEPKTSWGYTVSTEFINLDDIADGNLEIIGDLKLEARVRIFKEERNGMDRVSLIQVFDDSFVNGNGGFAPAPEQDDKKSVKK